MTRVRNMATARELGLAGWKSFLGPTQVAAAGAVLAPDEQAHLIERVRQAAIELKQLGARRVVLFGSLAYAERATPDSEVDLAVQDLPADRYWAAWRIAEEIVGDRLVDLVALEQASEPLRRAIKRDCVELRTSGTRFTRRTHP